MGNRLAAIRHPALDACQQMADIGKAELVDKGVAEAGGPVAGPAIEHHRRVRQRDKRLEIAQEFGMYLAGCGKGSDCCGTFYDAGVLPFLLAPDIDHDHAVGPGFQQILCGRLAKCDRRRDLEKLDLEN